MATITCTKAKLLDGTTQCLVGFMKVKDLLKHARVSTWQPKPHSSSVDSFGFVRGYQRLENPSHVNRIARSFANGGCCHGCLIMNLRNDDWTDHVTGKTSGNNITLDDAAVLWIIDGQQRTAAIRKHFESIEDPKAKAVFGKREIPVHIYFGNDGEAFEGRAFLLLNMSKSVQPDLRERLAQCWSPEDRVRMEAGQLPGIPSDLGHQLVEEARGCDVIDSLRLADSFLFPLIRTPNCSNDTVPLRQHSFVRSLRDSGLFRTAIFGGATSSAAEGGTSPAMQANLLHQFWSAVRTVWPQPFDEAAAGKTSKQRDYSLVSAVCFISLHKLFADILRCWEGDVTAERLVPILRLAAPNLNIGWYRRCHDGPEIGNGVEFWLSNNPMIRHKGNTEVVKELHLHVRDAIAKGSSLEAVVKQHTCEHNSRRGQPVAAEL